MSAQGSMKQPEELTAEEQSAILADRYSDPGRR